MQSYSYGTVINSLAEDAWHLSALTLAARSVIAVDLGFEPTATSVVEERRNKITKSSLQRIERMRQSSIEMEYFNYQAIFDNVTI